MWRIRAGVVALLVGAPGCGCGDGKDAGGGDDDDDDTVPAGPDNVRIDGAEAAPTDPESADLQLCATTEGAVIVAWADDRDGVMAVWARRSPDLGATWPDPPVRFGDPATVAEHPTLACAGAGAVLAWEDQRQGELLRPTLFAARTPDGGATWEASAAVASTEGEYQQLDPVLAAAGADEVAVAWYGDDNGAYDVFAARSSDGGATFGPAARVDSDDPGAAWSAHPAVALRDAAEIQVAWEDRRSGQSDVYVTGSDEGGFHAESRLDDGDAGSYAPVILVSGESAVDVAWHDRRDGDAYEVYFAHSADHGATFSGPSRLSTGEPAGTLDAVVPRLAASADGTVHAVFYAASGGGYHAVHRAIVDGAPGEATILDHAPPEALVRYPQIAVDGADVLVAWQEDRYLDEDAEHGDLYYTFSPDGGASFAPQDLRLDARLPAGPAATGLVVALSNGLVLAAWVDAREGTSDVWFARLPLGSAVSPPITAPL